MLSSPVAQKTGHYELFVYLHSLKEAFPMPRTICAKRVFDIPEKLWARQQIRPSSIWAHNSIRRTAYGTHKMLAYTTEKFNRATQEKTPKT